VSGASEYRAGRDVPGYGVNSFKFTNAQGQVRFGSYRIEPQAGNHFLSAEEVAKAAPSYLADEIHQRVTRAPVRFNFRVQLAEPEDKIDDPSIAWPEKRKTLDLGVIEITTVVPDSDAAERALLFLPAALPEGIEPADPMIQFETPPIPSRMSGATNEIPVSGGR
jgi:catalase